MAQPGSGDAMGWLMDFEACLLGEHGPGWKTQADDFHVNGIKHWYQWRDVRNLLGVI